MLENTELYVRNWKDWDEHARLERLREQRVDSLVKANEILAAAGYTANGKERKAWGKKVKPLTDPTGCDYPKVRDEYIDTPDGLKKIVIQPSCQTIRVKGRRNL